MSSTEYYMIFLSKEKPYEEYDQVHSSIKEAREQAKELLNAFGDQDDEVILYKCIPIESHKLVKSIEINKNVSE